MGRALGFAALWIKSFEHGSATSLMHQESPRTSELVGSRCSVADQWESSMQVNDGRRAQCLVYLSVMSSIIGKKSLKRQSPLISLCRRIHRYVGVVKTKVPAKDATPFQNCVIPWGIWYLGNSRALRIAAGVSKLPRRPPPYLHSR